MRGAGGHFADGDERLAALDLFLRGLKAAICLGELLGERARFLADLRGAQRESPADRQRR